jgi:hypothetical protein
MYSWNRVYGGAMALLLLSLMPIQAQPPAASAPVFHPLPSALPPSAGPTITAHAQSSQPFTVAGERGVILGQQNGSFEAWVLPVKLISNLRIRADIDGYNVPIYVNNEAAEIEVHPDRTIITYAHPGFTLRQIMFSPLEGPSGTGPVVLFQFDCLHPTTFTFAFTPELRWMWPQKNDGVPDADWETRGGFYVLHTDYPDFAGAITIPGAQPGILEPYQERA